MSIKAILIEKYGYSVQTAELMESDLLMLDAQIVPIYKAWKTNGEEKNQQKFHGYSINSLCADYGMNFFAALTTLDWIVKDPENAISALERGIM